MGFFDSKYKVEELDNPRKSGKNVYPYKVTSRRNGEVNYVSQKGLNAVKNINKRKEK